MLAMDDPFLMIPEYFGPTTSSLHQFRPIITKLKIHYQCVLACASSNLSFLQSLNYNLHMCTSMASLLENEKQINPLEWLSCIHTFHCLVNAYRAYMCFLAVWKLCWTPISILFDFNGQNVMHNTLLHKFLIVIMTWWREDNGLNISNFSHRIQTR